MNSNTIDTYVSELKQILCRTLSLQDLEEIAAEAKNHLTERAAELQTTGLSTADAERQATEEFGDAGELSIELADGYPPKPPVDPRRLRFLPEVAIIVMLSLSAYSFSVYGGPRGVEAAAGNLVPGTLILMVPGTMAGLGRLKYRRLRPLATLIRMSSYGLCLAVIGIGCLICLQVTDRATLTGIFPVYYAFGAAIVLMYWVTRISFTDGRIYTFFRHRLRRQ